MSKILVTGATGHLGKIVIDHLLRQTAAENVVALARSEEEAAAIKEKGIEVRLGDFDDTALLDQALKGIEKVLLISGVDPVNRLQQHKNVVDAAVKNGVKHLIYTGVSLKDFSTSANQFLMQSHFQTEEYIQQSGIGYTFFRDNLYFDVIPMYGGEQVLETGITAPAGDGKTAFALRSDIGEALANVLVQTNSENKIYDITGGYAYSFADIAQVLSELSGKQVTYTDIAAEAYRTQLKTFGVPEEFIGVLIAFATDVKNGQHEVVSNDLEQILGRKPAELNFAHAVRQTYIALGLALAQAAELKVDTTPAEGFSNELVDRILELEQYGLKSVCLMYVGYADTEKDWLTSMKKVRMPKEEFVINI